MKLKLSESFKYTDDQSFTMQKHMYHKASNIPSNDNFLYVLTQETMNNATRIKSECIGYLD
jgi:hypothetical protein